MPTSSVSIKDQRSTRQIDDLGYQGTCIWRGAYINVSSHRREAGTRRNANCVLELKSVVMEWKHDARNKYSSAG